MNGILAVDLKVLSKYGPDNIQYLSGTIGFANWSAARIFGEIVQEGVIGYQIIIGHDKISVKGGR